MKTQILGRGLGSRPFSHLQPVVEAEQEWGNTPRGEFSRGRDGWWYLSMEQPLHVDRLLDVFCFPDHIHVYREDDGSTQVIDSDTEVRIDGHAPGRFQGPLAPRRGLLSRLLGR